MANEWLNDRWIGGTQTNTPTSSFGDNPWSSLLPGISGLVGSAAGMPWSIILPLVTTLLGGLFGGGQSKEDELKEILKALEGAGFQKPYQSQTLSTMDPTIAQALLNNYSRYANWGFPEGMGMDTSFIEDALAQITQGGNAGGLGPSMGSGGVTPGRLGG